MIYDIRRSLTVFPSENVQCWPLIRIQTSYSLDAIFFVVRVLSEGFVDGHLVRDSEGILPCVITNILLVQLFPLMRGELLVPSL